MKNESNQEKVTQSFLWTKSLLLPEKLGSLIKVWYTKRVDAQALQANTSSKSAVKTLDEHL